MTMKRRQTKQIKIGSVGVGSDYPITVQSMTTTKTKDTEKTLCGGTLITLISLFMLFLVY